MEEIWELGPLYESLVARWLEIFLFVNPLNVILTHAIKISDYMGGCVLEQPF